MTSAVAGRDRGELVRRAGVVLALLGLAALEYAVALAYLGRGTWWHYVLHQTIGWGLGLAVAGAWMTVRRGYVPPLPAAVVGQSVSIVPDLMFKYARMPHTRAMDVWVGHISIHTGPSPTVVGLGVLLLGGASWLAARYGRRPDGVLLALAAVLLLTVSCLLASPVPTRLSDY